MYRLLTDVRYIVILVLLVITTIVMMACKRERSDYVGPEFIASPEGFMASNFSASPDLPSTVNLSTPGNVVTFSANFSARVTYVITLRGLSSTAKKVLTSTGWDPSALTWDGSHEGLYYFRSGEMVEATLSFFNSDVILKDTIQIAVGGTKKYGVLLNSYEGLPLSGGRGAFYGRYPNQPTDPGIDEIIYGDTSSKIRPIEGARVFTMDGKDLNGNYYIMSALQQDMYMYQLNLIDVEPEELYFNIYIYSHGVSGSRVSINFLEDDDYDITNPFGPPAHTSDAATDDIYKLIMVLPDKEGWYLYSIKYSDIPLSADASEGMNGNKIHEPEKLWGINLVQLTLQPGIHSKISFDNATFTVGKPLPPIE